MDNLVLFNPPSLCLSSLAANNFEDGSHVASPLDPNGNFNVVIKEEPLNDYEYELGEFPEGVTVKQEETDEETDVYSNSDDDPILEKQLKRHNKVDSLEVDYLSSKWLPNSPSGVAKAIYQHHTFRFSVSFSKKNKINSKVLRSEPLITKPKYKIQYFPNGIFQMNSILKVRGTNPKSNSRVYTLINHCQ